MMGDERRAWAYALHQVRRLKREGFDLLSGVSLKELHQHIEKDLSTYLKAYSLADYWRAPTAP